MKSTEQTIPLLTLLFVFLSTLAAPLMSQSVTISAEMSATNLIPGDEIDIVLSTQGESDFYFFSVETEFDAQVLEFKNVSTAGLSDGGLKVADNISSGKVGASVTRTEELSQPDEGDVMVLTFTVKEIATVGSNSITFSAHRLSDSSGTNIESVGPDPVDFQIDEFISVVELTIPAQFEAIEGEEFNATGKVFASEVTDNEENESRIRTWVGVNSSSSAADPANWEESAWTLMQFTEKDSEDFFNYTQEIALSLSPGEYFVALRSDLDEDQNYRYGGINGLWDETDSPSALMEISERPPFRYKIAAWNFDDETLTTSQSVPANRDVEIELIGASFSGSGFTTGASGLAANSSGWTDFEGESNYWQVVISTENFEELRLSSKQSGSNTGPGDFKIQTSIDGSVWSDLNDGIIEVGNNWTSGVVDNLSLPEALNDRSEVYVRWLQTSDLRIDQNEQGKATVTGAGTNRIDEIFITGINPDAERIDVWPGDTDNNGIVDENDVLPLGIYWLNEGPEPFDESFDWAPREVEAWVPVEATFADAAGNGRVDQNDLQVVGLNFGETNENFNAQKIKSDPIATLQLEPIQAGQSTELFIVTDKAVGLSGVSFRINIDGVNSENWTVDRIDQLEWGENWSDENSLIEFQTSSQNFTAAALTHRGFIEPEETKNIVKITIGAEQTWEHPVIAQLLRVSAVSGYQIFDLENATLSSEMAVSVDRPVYEMPRQTELLQNYPNPFNPVTTIPFTLAESGDVEIRIFDAIGRQVSRITREALRQGSYTVDFDASSLSSGVYFYRLSVNGIVQTRRMTLVK